MNAQEWVDRLRRNGDVHVVQFSPAECGEMARVFREVLDRRDWLEAHPPPAAPALGAEPEDV